MSSWVPGPDGRLRDGRRRSAYLPREFAQRQLGPAIDRIAIEDYLFATMTNEQQWIAMAREECVHQ
jgi:hypothetical protein